MIVAKPGFRLPYSSYIMGNLLYPSHQTTGIIHIGVCNSNNKPFLCNDVWVWGDINNECRNITCIECQKIYLALKKV